ncbi:MAG TPA: plastocyanin/azurin family copper-binding protein [Actinomycetota bacterium]
MGLLLILTAVLASAALVGGGDSTPEVRSATLRLTPKSELPVIEAKEGVNWTHAPAVPPRVERAGQARIVVSWSANEFTKNLDPANGVRYAAWGFEGASPGPLLRARVGDLIEVRLTNDAKAEHSHNIDFHFATGPGGGASALNVAPGQTATVEVRALAPGIYMYHCATPDIPTHIANGMYGYVIVEPEGGLPEVDEELYVVQSEFYAKGGGVRTLDVAKLDNEEPTYVVLNGAVGSLMGDNSPKVRVGDRVRIWYGNAGPQLISSFHVIGEIFDRVYREGDLVSAPAQSVQTTMVPAGGATAVELTIDVPGTYLLVDHAIARTLHKGAVGAIVADGDTNDEVYAAGANNPPGRADDGHGGGQTVGTAVSITEGAWDPANAARAFTPREVTIKAGETVTWTNDDAQAHTVTADDDAFDSGFIEATESFSLTFEEAGTYRYFCTPHPWMKGTIIAS